MPEGTKAIDKEIKEIVKKVVLEEEIVKLKEQDEKQLAQARQQFIIWDTRIKQLTGKLATYKAILEKSQETKNLQLKSDNTEPKKK